ncbi:unnamed protein product [Urochloa humidicola]
MPTSLRPDSWQARPALREGMAYGGDVEMQLVRRRRADAAQSRQPALRRARQAAGVASRRAEPAVGAASRAGGRRTAPASERRRRPSSGCMPRELRVPPLSPKHHAATPSAA